jgi:hypothetical protein
MEPALRVNAAGDRELAAKRPKRATVTKTAAMVEENAAGVDVVRVRDAGAAAGTGSRMYPASPCRRIAETYLNGLVSSRRPSGAVG